MANLKDTVQQLLDAGVDPAKIRARLSGDPRVKSLTDQGVDQEKVFQRLGLPALAPAAVATTVESTPAESPAGPGLGDTLVHGAGIIGSGLVKGAVEGSVGLPGAMRQLEQKYLPQGVTDFFAKAADTAPEALGLAGPLVNLLGGRLDNVMPTPSSLEGHLNSLGLSAEPRNTTEAQIDAISRGVGGAAVTLPLGGAGVVPTLLAGAGSGEGAYWGGQLAPKGWETSGSMLGGLAGGLVGAGPVMQKIANNAVVKTLTGAENDLGATVAGVDAAQKALDDARAAHAKLQNAGTDLNLEHQQNLLNMDIEHQQLIKNTNANAEAQIQAVTQPAQKAIADHADALGASDTPQAVGETLQNHAKDWVNGLDSKLGKIWEPVDANVPPQTEVGLPNLKNALDDMNTKAGTLEPLNRLLKPALPQQLSQALTHVKNAAEMDIVPPATYQDARVLRTTLGKALTDPKILNSVGESNAKQLYGALTSDIRSALVPLGLDGAFDAANVASRSLYNFADQHISKIIANVEGVGNNTPETVANRIANLGKNGGTMFSTLRAQMPEAMDDLASYVVRSGKWSKMAPEAKEGLVPDPTVRASLDANHAALESGAAPIKTAAQQTIDTNADRIAQIKQLQAQQKIDQGKAVSESTKGLAEHAERLRAAKEAQESAKAVLEMLKESTSGNANNLLGIKALLKSDVAGQIGDLALQTVGEPAATLLKLGIRAAPLVRYGTNVIKRNPKILQEGVRGAFIGSDVGNRSIRKNELAP